MPNTTWRIYYLAFPGVQSTSPLPTGCYPTSSSPSAGGKGQGTSCSGGGSPTTLSHGARRELGCRQQKGWRPPILWSYLPHSLPNLLPPGVTSSMLPTPLWP